jgi:hypothetical protein
MPRSQPLRPQPVPKVRPAPLEAYARCEIAEFLGLAALSDDAADGVAAVLAAYWTADKTGQWRGLTPRKSANGLRRIAEFLNRATRKMRALTEPSDVNAETAELLHNEAEALVAQMRTFRERALAQAAALDAMPTVRPHHEALTQAAGFLRHIFEAFAVPHVRDSDPNLRGFVLACLHAGGVDTGDLKEHPHRLREMLKAKVLLATPDWPRTPGVWA